MDSTELKLKFTPRFLGNGFFPRDFNILKNSRISVQYVYFAMFALWNEFEFFKHKELLKYYSVKNKTINDKKIEKLLMGENKISSSFDPLIKKLVEKGKEKTEYLESIKTRVDVGDHEVMMYATNPGEGLYIPFSGEIFAHMYMKDAQFCNMYQIGRSSLSKAREKLKELNLIDYGSGCFSGKKMTWFTFIPPIKKWIEIPLKIFYLKNLSRSSKVILFWLNKFLKETDIKGISRKNFMRFSGFRNEKTLRRLRSELIAIFPSLEDLLKTIL